MPFEHSHVELFAHSSSQPSVLSLKLPTVTLAELKTCSQFTSSVCAFTRHTRTTLYLLGEAGYDAIAPDFPGHGNSDKPGSSDVYSEAGMIAGIDGFVAALGLKTPLALGVQGFITSQYGLLWALKNESKVARLMILNTPVALGSKLRPELAAYKTISFLRPKGTFDSNTFCGSGNAYVIDYRTAEAYALPYADPAATAAVATIVDKCDFSALVKRVSSGYQLWRKPSVLLFGGADPFVKVKDVFDFLDDKRTNMKVISSPAKLGHCPQEDYPEAVHESMLPWLAGETDEWKSGRIMKMTKRGGVEV